MVMPLPASKSKVGFSVNFSELYAFRVLVDSVTLATLMYGTVPLDSTVPETDAGRIGTPGSRRICEVSRLVVSFHVLESCHPRSPLGTIVCQKTRKFLSLHTRYKHTQA